MIAVKQDAKVLDHKVSQQANSKETPSGSISHESWVPLESFDLQHSVVLLDSAFSTTVSAYQCILQETRYMVF